MDGLREQALRIYRRYQIEFVEALEVCPWAAKARRDDRVRPEVVLDREPSAEATVDAVRRLGDDPEVDIGLLIHPRIRVDPRQWEHFVAEVRAADARRGPVIMALAAFHPDAPVDMETPARLIPFLRRSPDPTIQLVRTSVLERVRKAESHGTGFVDPSMLNLQALLDQPPQPPLHERVAVANLERVRTVGLDRVHAILEDIRRDRDDSYAPYDP